MLFLEYLEFSYLKYYKNKKSFSAEQVTRLVRNQTRFLYITHYKNVFVCLINAIVKAIFIVSAITALLPILMKCKLIPNNINTGKLYLSLLPVWLVFTICYNFYNFFRIKSSDISDEKFILDDLYHHLPNRFKLVLLNFCIYSFTIVFSSGIYTALTKSNFLKSLATIGGLSLVTFVVYLLLYLPISIRAIVDKKIFIDTLGIEPTLLSKEKINNWLDKLTDFPLANIIDNWVLNIFLPSKPHQELTFLECQNLINYDSLTEADEKIMLEM